MAIPVASSLPAPAAPATFRGEARELFSLAWPLALSFGGNNLLGFVATALVGRVDAAELAGVSIGFGIFFTVTVAGAGVVFGMDPLVAQALGAEEGARARATLRAGLRLAVWLSLVATLVVVLAPLALPALGIEPRIAESARRFSWARAPSALPFMLLLAVRGYLQARHVTRPVVAAMVVANVVNALLCLPLVLGDRGLAWVGVPPLGLAPHGALGAGIAGSVATVAQLAVTAAAFSALEPAAGGGDTEVRSATLFRLGLPIGLTALAEVGAFMVSGILAGRLGSVAAGGHQVALTVASATFTVSLAISDATSVRVGHAVGRGDPRGVRFAGFAGLAAAALWMSATALALVSSSRAIASVLSDQADIVAVAAPLLQIAGAFQLFDGAQVVGAGALRGLGDTRPAQWAALVGYYLVGLPLAWGLAFRAGMGVRGVWWGLSAGLAIVGITLVLRFEQRSRGPIARLE